MILEGMERCGEAGAPQVRKRVLCLDEAVGSSVARWPSEVRHARRPNSQAETSAGLLHMIRFVITESASLSQRFSTGALSSRPDRETAHASTSTPLSPWASGKSSFIESAVNAAPTARSRVALAVLYFLEGRYADAISIQLAVASEPCDIRLRAIALANATDALTMLSRFEQAWMCVLKSLELDPDRPATYAALLSTALLSKRTHFLVRTNHILEGVRCSVEEPLRNAAGNRRARLSTKELRRRIDWNSCAKEALNTCPRLVEARFV
jgi:hypothetical protein